MLYVVLEKIPAELAKEVSESLSIPTIGIGANVLRWAVLCADMLSINTEFKPAFYAST
jgi:3-methyl-2-oxobutanoate hydroxymethyltransferase